MRVGASAVTLESLLDRLAARAVDSQGVPTALATRARRITSRNLSHLGQEALDRFAVHRVQLYFAAVVRRASVRADTPEVKEYRRRLIAASLAADLRAVGMDETRVEAEVSASLAGVSGWPCQVN